MTTFAAVLSARLRDDPGQPLVTFYDDASGERVELSVTTYANWVAKAASLGITVFGVTGRNDDQKAATIANLNRLYGSAFRPGRYFTKWTGEGESQHAAAP